MKEPNNAHFNNDSKSFTINEEKLEEKISYIKERGLEKLSPIILLKPAIFSIIILFFSFFIDLSSIPFLGNITIDLAKDLYPNWQPVENAIEPIQFWWLPLVSYLFFFGIALKEYRGLFNHVRTTTPRENVDRIISSSISLIDGYATALPLVGAAFLLVSIKLGPEIFLGLSVPFEIKSLIVLALAKLFEPVLDYIGVKFQKVLNEAQDYKEKYYKKIQIEQNNKIINLLSQSIAGNIDNSATQIDNIKKFREEIEQIKLISFETYQNFSALNKITESLKNNLDGNKEHLDLISNTTKTIDSLANNLSNESVAQSLSSLELIINRR